MVVKVRSSTFFSPDRVVALGGAPPTDCISAYPWMRSKKLEPTAAFGP